MRSRIEVIVGLNIVDIALRAIAQMHDIHLQRFNIVVERVRLLAHLICQINPLASLLGVLIVEGLDLVVHGVVARRENVVGAHESLLHLSEPIEHIARHIQCKHSRQNDVHQVDHLLTRRHASYRLVSSVCHALIFRVIIIVDVHARHTTHRAIHVHGHGLNHFFVHAIELLHVACHFFGFVAVVSAFGSRFFIHISDILQAAVHAVDAIELRRDALELDFVDGVQAADVSVEGAHLLYVAGRA